MQSVIEIIKQDSSMQKYGELFLSTQKTISPFYLLD